MTTTVTASSAYESTPVGIAYSQGSALRSGGSSTRIAQRMNGSAVSPRPRCTCAVISGIERSMATAPKVSVKITFARSDASSSARAASCASCSSMAVRPGSGRLAPYPVARMASTRLAGDVTSGSYATLASFVMRLTVASSTPGWRWSVRCTRA